MCGRFTFASDTETLQQAFFDFEVPMNLSPRYNISPTQDVAVIANIRKHPPEGGHVEFFHWGLIPFWAKEPSIGNRMINARSETLAEKPSFPERLQTHRRCLVSWQMAITNGRRFRANGLNNPSTSASNPRNPSRSQDSGRHGRLKDMEEPIRSCTIITCPPNALLEEIHHRMPVILPQDAYAEWLSPDERSADTHSNRSSSPILMKRWRRTRCQGLSIVL